MRLRKLPSLRLPPADVKSKVKFKTPASVMARWDRTLKPMAKADDSIASIDILGEIGDSMWGGISAGMIKEQLDAIGEAPVLVTLNSPGGDAFEGVAIFNLLRDHPGKITMNVLGIAASAASVIAMAGDETTMGEAAFLMIHSSWGFVAGNQADMREFADLLDALDQAVAGLYASRTGLAQDEILTMMRAETWLSGSDAVEKGFADIAISSDPKSKPKTRQTASRPVFASFLPNGSLAASGDRRPEVRMSASSRPGAAGTQPKGNSMKPIQEQIAAFEAKRAASAERMNALMSAAADAGRTLDEAETQEYDALKAEIKAVDDHLVRLRSHEAQMAANATPINPAAGADPAAASAARDGTSRIISVRSNVEKGIAFTRYVKALAMARGNLTGALAIAQNNKEWNDTTPQVTKVLMAAVAGGDTTTAGWASELVYKENLVNEFIELLRPQTIIGKIPNLTRVPFNVRMGSQTSGSTAYWVGQGVPVPVSKLGTSEVTLGIAKAAGLIVLTEELVRSSQPSAELLVRNDLTKAIAQFLDVQFIDPNYAPVTNVSPGSVTYGITGADPSGTDAAAVRKDVQGLFAVYIAANLDPTGACWIMTPTTALALSLMVTSLGVPVFPTINMNGGVWFGLPVITSQSAKVTASPDDGNLIVLANAPEILLADDGDVTIDASREASLEMLDNPTNNAAAGTPTTMVSMFQTNSVAIRAVRFINWKKRRTTAVAFIHKALYT
jgi:HK97 family phage major capsid protein